MTILETPEVEEATDEIRLGEAGTVADAPRRNVDAGPDTPVAEEAGDAWLDSDLSWHPAVARSATAEKSNRATAVILRLPGAMIRARAPRTRAS